MADGTTTYGDISPRTAGYVVPTFLKRADPYMFIPKVAQTKALPGKNTSTVIFRRYNKLPNIPANLVLLGGVTPTGQQLTKTDVTLTLTQYGNHLGLTDIIEDTHEDPVLQQMMEVCGEQAGESMEKMYYGVLKAGTNVYYANGTARTAVNTPFTLALQRKVTRTLKRQDAKPITSTLKSTPNYGTEAVGRGYVAIAHPDLEPDLRVQPGFVPVEKYGPAMSPWDGEVGKIEDCRYVLSSLYEPFADAGGTYNGSGTAMLTTTGTSADVYPIIYIARDAFACVALKGKFAVTPIVVNTKPSKSDPLGQRGHVGWKTMQGAVILNDLWMCRAEVAVRETPVTSLS